MERKLQVWADEEHFEVVVPQFVLDEGEGFFARMDRDMDGGWQMGRLWVDSPDTLERCQIVAERLLDALHRHNEQMAAMMAGYILARSPGTTGVRVAGGGEMHDTELVAG